jgi:hypothetical protein
MNQKENNKIQNMDLMTMAAMAINAAMMKSKI